MDRAQKIKAMKEGGALLAKIRDKLVSRVESGVSAYQIDQIADKLISEVGGEASFKQVPGYKWATCINVNNGVVHGIPKRELIFKKGDLVSIDVGLKYQGYHTDTSITVGVGSLTQEEQSFLLSGQEILSAAINKANPGGRVGDISKVIGDGLKKRGLSPIRVLTGHGIGRGLHEQPYIPLFQEGPIDRTLLLEEGMALAIEVIYSSGSGRVKLDEDGWTIVTADGKIAGLFEETVVINDNGHIIVTKE